jgi:hypothetical protein
MKRCPECYETYDDIDRFCELDGHELLLNPTVTTNEEEAVVPTLGSSPSKEFSWPTAIMGMIAGMVIGTGIYAVYSFTSNQPEPVRQPRSTLYMSDARGPAEVKRAAPEPSSEAKPQESPSEEAETEPSPEPSITVAADSQTAKVRLNQGPVSTGEKSKKTEVENGVHTIIQMNDGTVVEVDAAWQDKQGVWYRRGGLVSFVESERVKAITERTEPKPSDH